MRSDLRCLALALFASGALADPLVGSGVGNADTFVSEGSKLFNKKQYPKASEQFLKATRANPALTQTYAQLARAQILAKELQRACYAYRVYLKSVPDSPDRKGDAGCGENAAGDPTGQRAMTAACPRMLVGGHRAHREQASAVGLLQERRHDDERREQGHCDVDRDDGAEVCE